MSSLNSPFRSIPLPTSSASAVSPPLSPLLNPRDQQTSRINDIRSKIIRNNVEVNFKQHQQRSPSKSSFTSSPSSLSSNNPIGFAPVGKLNDSFPLPLSSSSSGVSTSTSTSGVTSNSSSTAFSTSTSSSSSFNNTPRFSTAPLSTSESPLNWKHPQLTNIQRRVVNKEIQVRRILINFSLLLIWHLCINFTKLVLVKMELTMEPYENVAHIPEVLFLYNILQGVYNLVKKEDVLQDLTLSERQRSLLALPPFISSPTSTSSSDIALPDSTTTSQKAHTIDTNRATPATTTTNTTSRDLHKKVKPLIASPMASSPNRKFTNTTSPKKSPLKFDLKPTLTSSSLITNNSKYNNKIIPSLSPASHSSLTNIQQGTPSYIPSNKFLSRMDSPTKSRRRV